MYNIIKKEGTMRISTTYGFVFICMPKCASTSIEKALLPYSQFNTRGDTQLKHTSFEKYNEFIKPFLNSSSKTNIETVCLMREPISWLHSWFKYLSRDVLKSPEHKNHHRYCGDFTFEEWIIDYLSKKPPKYVVKRSQRSYLVSSDGTVGVDKIFKYEDMTSMQKYFEDKIGKKIEFPNLNISPIIEYKLTPQLENRLKSSLKEDYEIYNSL